MNNKSQFLLYFILAISCSVLAQKPVNQIDSLRFWIANKNINDTTKVLALDQLSLKLMASNVTEAYKYANEGLLLTNKINFSKGKIRILNRLALIYTRSGNYALSLKTAYEAKALAEKFQDIEGLGKIYNNMSIFYSEQKEFSKALEYDKKVKEIADNLNNKDLYETALLNLGADYISLNQLDSAEYYLEKIYAIQLKNEKRSLKYVTLQNLGNINYLRKDYTNALKKYKICVENFINYNDNINLGDTYFYISQIFEKLNRPDSSIFYSKKAFNLALKTNNFNLQFQTAKLLNELNKNRDISEAYKYLNYYAAAKDSIYNVEKLTQLKNVVFQEKVRQQQLVDSEKEYNSKLKFGFLFALLGALSLISIIQFRNNRHKNKINRKLEAQKSEIELQGLEIQKSLETLKSTQKQLIQQEKLASLGELTAGIAHEIQNPLNFVNNFSELNSELITEIKEEQLKPKTLRDDDLVAELVNDLEKNEDKILFHGKRASGIVKAMLEHSRNNTGQKTLVDVNSLTDEFLRLSYLSLRAKYKDFNAEFELIGEENLPKIEAVSQDIGRVLLNLFNNAFYSLKERSIISKGIDFQPKLTVSTKVLPNYNFNGKTGFVEIKVNDNGIGMSDAIKDKILQPFFTTKPTGEGTGLGLSLSYDIVTKGHQGQIDIESVQNQSTTFTVRLPIKA